MTIKRILSYIIISALLICCTGVIPAAAVGASDDSATDALLQGNNYKEGTVLLTAAFPDDVPVTEVTESLNNKVEMEHAWDFGDARGYADNAVQRRSFRDKSLYIMEVSSETYSTRELIEKLGKQEYVLSVEPDYYQEKCSVNDMMTESQWYLDGLNVNGRGINYSGVNQDIYGSPDVNRETPVVAVVDTGIDYTHPDLAENMWINTHSELEGTYGYDFGDDDMNPMDSEGHGTHCAGIIGAAVNNNTGIAGVSSHVKLMALKIADSNENMANSSIIGAFNYIYEAQTLGENIVAVNCSWGGGSSSSAMKKLVEQIGGEGALFVFAAGNASARHSNYSEKECPYDINSPYLVTVGASDTEDGKSWFSDYGAREVDIFAPGSMILSTVCYDTFYPALFPESERNEMCSYFSSCDSALEMDVSSLYIKGGLNVNNIEYSSEDVFGDVSSGSLCLKHSGGTVKNWPDIPIGIPDFDRGETVVYIDMSSEKHPESDSYYIACDIGVEKNPSEILWIHKYNKVTPDSYLEKDGKIWIKICGINSINTVSGIYIDNISVSKANPSEDILCRYDVMNGTSMAAPIVSAAVAILAFTYTMDTSVERFGRLLNCARMQDSLYGYCYTEGILDLGRISDAGTEYTGPAGSYGPDYGGNGSTALPGVVTGSYVSGGLYSPDDGVRDNGNAGHNNNLSDGNVYSGDGITKLIKKISFNKKKLTVHYKKKKKYKLGVNVKPSDATNKNLKWYVAKRDKKYIIISQTGTVWVNKKGIGHNVTVFAKAKDGSDITSYCIMKIRR